jgi:PKD repeat protein
MRTIKMLSTMILLALLASLLPGAAAATPAERPGPPSGLERPAVDPGPRPATPDALVASPPALTATVLMEDVATRTLTISNTGPARVNITLTTAIVDDFRADSGLWTYTDNAYRDAVNGYVVLTEAVGGQTGRILLRHGIATPFNVEFRYRAGGGSGADGFVLMFYKDPNYMPCGAGDFGFTVVPNCDPVPGYGIEFDSWNNPNYNDPSSAHIALIKDHPRNHLAWFNDPRVNDNQWHDVRVVVGVGSVTVAVDGGQVLAWQGTLDRTYAGLGFGAGTGAASDWHIIDDVVVGAGGADWFSFAPVGAALPPYSSLAVETTFDAAGLQPGEYTTDLLVLSDDPGTPVLDVPVTMTVVPLPTMGWVEGTVTDACTGAPMEATIVAQGQPYTVTSDPDTGHYLLWLEAGSYTLQATAPGYLPATAAVVIAAQQGTTRNLALALDGAPCLVVAPPALTATVYMDAVATRTLTISNTGPAGANVTLTASPGLAAAALLLPLEEPAGATVFYDASGNGNHGSCVGETCPTAGVEGRFGRAAYFDGTDDYITIPDDPTLDLTRFSVGVWFKPTTDQRYAQILVAKQATNGFSRNYALFFDPKQEFTPPRREVHFSFQDDDCVTWRSYNSYGEVPLGVWNQAVMTYDGSYLNLYLNGQLDRSESIVSPVCLNDYPVKIGRELENYYPFLGSLDEVLITSHVLSAEEVAALYWYRYGQTPWLSVDPLTGTLTPSSTLPVTVTFDAVGLQPGEFTTNLLVFSDDPGTAVLDIPVTMTVVPRPTMGWVEGTVTDACTGAPLETTVVALGQPYTVTSDPDTGHYILWLEPGRYTLTMAAAGYLGYAAPVTFTTGQGVILDVPLVPDRPCIAAAPETFVVWLLTGTAVYTHPTGLDIVNRGGQDLTYILHEVSGTTAPGLGQAVRVSLPAGPLTVPTGTAMAAGPTYTPMPTTTYTITVRPRPATPADVLLLMADDGNGEPIRSQLQAFGDLGAVDVYDAYYGTPTLAELQAYDVVLTWSNYHYADPNAIGNVLADYVDAGGRVINLMASMGTHGWQMGGRFMNEGYTAVNGGDGLWSTSCLGTYDPAHPIMSRPDPITDVCDYMRLAGTYLTPGSTAVARWQDNEILVGVKDDRSVASITSYVGYYWGWTGQIDALVHNAILWLAVPPYTDVPWLWEVPTTTVVPAQGAFNNGLYFSALYTDGSPLALRAYTATLYVENDDPVAEPPELPVVLHVVAEYIPPTAYFFSNGPVCDQEVIFVNASDVGIPPVVTYLWDFGDGLTSTSDLQVLTHSYAAPGIYTVTLTVTQFQTGWRDTYEDQVAVWYVVAGFSYAVDEFTVTFIDHSVNATSWLWDFSDGVTSTLRNPVHTYAGPGLYSVRQTVFNDCDEATLAQQVLVSGAPEAAFQDNSPVCLGVQMVFTNTTGGIEPITYLWAFGDGGTATETNPVHLYTAAGSYTVTLEASNEWGSSQARGVVAVLAQPMAAFTYTANGLVVTFANASANAASYLWTFGDGGTSTEANPVHAYAAAGTYEVSLAATGECGTDTDMLPVTVVSAGYHYYLPLVVRGRARAAFFLRSLR